MRKSTLQYLRVGVLSLTLALGSAGLALAQRDNGSGAGSSGGTTTGTTAGNTSGTTSTTDGRTDRGFDWGWLGLIGLVGLVPLFMRRNGDMMHRPRDTSGRSPAV